VKLEDLSRVLAMLEPTISDGSEITEEFKQVCHDMTELTTGPTELFQVMFDKGLEAVQAVVELDFVQTERVRKIISNTVQVTLGALIEGGAVRATKPIDDLKAALNDAVRSLSSEVLGEEEEDEFEVKPPKSRKEVVH